jgi:hypothetical protein
MGSWAPTLLLAFLDKKFKGSLLNEQPGWKQTTFQERHIDKDRLETERQR